MEERRSKKIEKADFLSRLNEMAANLEKPMTEEMLIAQGVIFFVAGFETTGSTLSTFCRNLAIYPETQERIFDEIQEVLEATDGKITQVIILTNITYS